MFFGSQAIHWFENMLSLTWSLRSLVLQEISHVKQNIFHSRCHDIGMCDFR
jgi:hypothetical protein